MYKWNKVQDAQGNWMEERKILARVVPSSEIVGILKQDVVVGPTEAVVVIRDGRIEECVSQTRLKEIGGGLNDWFMDKFSASSKSCNLLFVDARIVDLKIPASGTTKDECDMNGECTLRIRIDKNNAAKLLSIMEKKSTKEPGGFLGKLVIKEREFLTEDDLIKRLMSELNVKVFSPCICSYTAREFRGNIEITNDIDTTVLTRMQKTLSLFGLNVIDTFVAWKVTPERKGEEEEEEPFSKRAYLIYVDDKLVETPICVENELTIGRSTSSKEPIVGKRIRRGRFEEINVQDGTVSRFERGREQDGHAQFVLDGGVFYIADLKSANGTYLNGMRLNPNKRYNLSPGDTVRVGRNTQFRIESDPNHFTVPKGDSVIIPPSKGSKKPTILNTGNFDSGEYRFGGRRIFIKDMDESPEQQEIRSLDKMLTDGKRFMTSSKNVSVSDIIDSIVPAMEQKIQSLGEGSDAYAKYQKRFDEIKKECAQGDGGPAAVSDIEKKRIELQKIVEEMHGEMCGKAK